MAHHHPAQAVLIGCGITGSWVLPVLVRTIPKVVVYDDDVVDSANRHGLWYRTGFKARAVIEPRFRATYVVRSIRLTAPSQLRGRCDLAVLCPDNAPTRRLVGRTLKARVEAGRTVILDIRATPVGLVTWAVNSRALWRSWMHSLNGYPDAMPCNHHDDVPITAGAAAAHFAAWWMTSGRPSGFWVTPYGPPEPLP